MTKFTKEFIASELALAEKATPGPIVMEWNWKWGMTSVCAWVETPRHSGDKFTDVAEMADNDRLYSESAYNNYPAALAEIQRLREKLKEANDRTNELYCSLEAARDTVDPRDAEIENLRERIAELEAQQEWHPCSEPPDDVRWVAVEVVYAHTKTSNIVPGWYDNQFTRWNVEHNGYSNILRWRELPGGGE